MKNFKMNKLAFAVAASLGAATLSPSIQAVNIAEDGKGEVLLFPYYTVNGGWDTYVSVINTSDRTVMFKIRFREALNSRDARDFNVILSPRDIWAAAVTLNGETGAARIQTVDNTCTAPRLPIIDAETGLRGIDFTNLDYISPGTGGANRADTGPGTLDRTREGYIEIIEMGVARSELDQTPIDAKHVTVDGVRAPQGCNAIVSRFNNNLGQLLDEFNEPENILKGTGVLIKVDEGKAAGFDPTVLANFFNPLGNDGESALDLVQIPASELPNLSSVNPAVAVLLTNVVPTVPGLNDGDGSLVASFSRSVDAVSALLMRTSVINQFNVADAARNGTDWVVTFPTKNFYVDTVLNSSPESLSPFQFFFQDDADGDGQSCVTVSFDFVDREEFSPEVDIDLDFSPRPPGAPANSICFEANVLTFRETNVLQSPNSANVPVEQFGIANGAMNLTFISDQNSTAAISTSTPDLILTSDEGFEFHGLPTIGFAFSTAENGVAQEGRVLNYGMAWDHSYQRLITGEAVSGRDVIIS